MSAKVFFDSNIVLYTYDPIDARKRNLADRLIEQSLLHNTGCISSQVVQECLSFMTKKAMKVLDDSKARLLYHNALKPLCRICLPDLALYDHALDIHECWRYSFYDALIIAAALKLGCRTLYSEDLQHGQHIENLTIINPFQE